MGVTYTRAADRARAQGAVAPAPPHAALIVTSLVAVLAIAVCVVGRLRAFDAVEAASGTTARAIDLSQHPSARAIEPALAPAFADATDRALAAGVIASAVAKGGPLENPPNVGALARLTVPAETIARTRGLDDLATRLADARARAGDNGPPATVPVFTSAAFTAIKPAFVVRTRAEHRRVVLWCLFALVASVHVIALVWRWAGRAGDPILLAAAHLLVVLGALVMISRPDPLRDTLLIEHFTIAVVLGSLACAAASLVRVRTAGILQLPYLALAGALGLALTLAVFGSGPGGSGAKVNLGPAQPVELIRLLLALFLAGYLGRRWELLRQVRETGRHDRPLPRWLEIPRIDQVLPVLGPVTLALVLFFVLHDLGPALLIALLFLLLFTVARAGAGALVAGVALLAAGFAAGYWLDVSGTLTGRVAMWMSPWQNAARGGDQVAQALWAMATGAVSGTGLGLGDPRYLPAGHTDLVFAAIGEELGFIGLATAALAGVVITLRGLRIARNAPTDTTCFLALALTLSLVLPMLVMAAGILGLLPLTGVVTPFVSYGGSAMLINFVSVGLLAAIASDEGPRADLEPFAGAARWIGRGLAACAVTILVVAARTQVFAADATLVRPQLGVQADGGMRYQYNPRVLDASSTLARGSILDRNGLVVAGDPARVRQSRAALARIGVADNPCGDDVARCYPLGGRGFHVLGDAVSRTNWTASNTSYVERDADDNLRGFDDHARAVRVVGSQGHETAAVRRDYTEILPLVRHRWQPDNAAVRVLRSRPRDVHLTLDAGLQMQVSSALAHAGVARGAVVVVDAASGDVLASVSYPWPAADATNPDDQPLLDRARYGLYPPGSTFKLITAAAALRLDPASNSLAFTCSRLADGRVGVKLAGSGRPVRDDIRDETPHGTLTLHDALVRSCNAYFAQLAVKIGTEPLARTSELAGIVFPTSGTAAHQRDVLPYDGYGQGEVLASPLRMARMAAALATDGVVRDSPMVSGDRATEAQPFVPPATARLLAGYMRDAVTAGTGRLLASHPLRIAGKTGTAEVANARSHAWFVGYAPATPGARRIAFAVLLENAGYGGATAASVAGQVVSAASALGLMR